MLSKAKTFQKKNFDFYLTGDVKYAVVLTYVDWFFSTKKLHYCF